MSTTRYRFDTFFRAYERHLFNFPKGHAFRKQWNIALTAGTGPDEDQVRIGVGFRLSAHENAHGIEEYFEFREQVREQKEAFDQLCQELGNYYEFWEPGGRSVFQAAPGPLSLPFLRDEPPLDAWRFFGRCLRVCDPQDRAVICSHELLQSAVVDVCDRIQSAGFGM